MCSANLDGSQIPVRIQTGIYDFHPCGKCCATCFKLTSCRYACPKLADQIAQQKAERLAESRRKKAAEAEEDAPAIEAITRIWRRFGELREQAGVSIDDVRAGVGFSCGNANNKRFREMELGKHIDAYTFLPFSTILLYEVECLVELADLFGCSLDYLLCRTDVKEMAAAAPVSESGTMWHPITEEPPVGVDLVWLDARGYSDTGKYEGGQRISIVSTISWDEARWWAYKPEDKE